MRTFLDLTDEEFDLYLASLTGQLHEADARTKANLAEIGKLYDSMLQACRNVLQEAGHDLTIE